MPTPAQYQMTPNMQQAQQQQPQQQVYAYLQPPQQQQAAPIGGIILNLLSCQKLTHLFSFSLYDTVIWFHNERYFCVN
jgi:hypothetical protein